MYRPYAVVGQRRASATGGTVAVPLVFLYQVYFSKISRCPYEQFLFSVSPLIFALLLQPLFRDSALGSHSGDSPYIPLRCMPTCFSRGELSIFSPRRLESNCAYAFYWRFLQVNFSRKIPQEKKSCLAGFEPTTLTLVVARFNR